MAITMLLLCFYYAFFILGEISVKRILSFWPDEIVLKEP